jgi:DNA-binding transcriptional ArsR family regulator
MLTALMPRARVKVLALLILRAGTDHYLREVARLAGVPLRAAQRELARLAAMGLVEAKRRGHQVFFTVDTNHPLFAGLRSLLLNTEAIAVPLRAALSSVGGIEAAALFGPKAGSTGAEGDVFRLLVVGEPDRRALHAAITAVEADVGRAVSYPVMSRAEFTRRRAASDPFLERALSGLVIPVLGDVHAI